MTQRVKPGQQDSGPGAAGYPVAESEEADVNGGSISSEQSPPDQEPVVDHAAWLVGIFIFTPLLALFVALPVALSGILPLTWLDLVIGLVFYLVTAVGITVGYHRYFTHGSFKTNSAVRWFLAIAGSMAVEGPVAEWVADHRKHHAFSDKPGDPHSPWRFGTSTGAVAKGLWYAHMGWLLSPEVPREVDRYAPDIQQDRITGRAARMFPLLVAATLFLPAVVGGLITWSWIGALSAFFWAGLVRIALVHQVTWSINSVCHVWGKRQFKSRDLSGNVAWLAIPSLGESWHNYHHADPTAARHGVLVRQFDVSAVIIRALERAGQAHDVRWPEESRVQRRMVAEENGRVHKALRG